ncbi:type 1 glutamine amidotransferase domain-containing protein [Leucobacter triazinivorans]|uniref:Type 1 glutamine amidotransferase n=1 Tax=Leucobacter triazinivorans TaxID=1784719 RepID=A0A4P6KDZ3_9MICO|nr:type 1 glutamine amidotransferase domain-containing protein [Leucobacter triazinivorans]QBE48161.1 type 1 glutamine amidotransferase [Leucobacter triazinivorans]
MTHLTGKRVAILATNGFEDSELTEPLAALREHGAEIEIVSTNTGTIRGKNGHEAHVARASSAVRAEDYDALVLPGGVVNGDHIRLDQHAVDFTRGFFEQHKPVAAICHGGWILTDADVLRGRTVTSYPSLRTDLKNAGATWVDEEVVVDQGLVTSRTPDDLPAFNAKLVEEIAEGKHSGQTV